MLESVSSEASGTAAVQDEAEVKTKLKVKNALSDERKARKGPLTRTPTVVTRAADVVSLSSHMKIEVGLVLASSRDH